MELYIAKKDKKILLYKIDTQLIGSLYLVKFEYLFKVVVHWFEFEFFYSI